MTAGCNAGPTTCRRMTVADLDRVLVIEAIAYSFPWTRGNFIDSLAAGYLAELMLPALGGEPIGYYVAMPVVDELHLLNLTVAPAHQRRGYARTLLDRVELQARERSLATLWLEVRQSNARAIAVYRARGFAQSGLRRAYYPAQGGRREDAVVMTLMLDQAPRAHDSHAVE